VHAISEDLKRLNGKLESAQLYVDQKINKREHGKKSQVDESDAAPLPHGEGGCPRRVGMLTHCTYQNQLKLEAVDRIKI
jgi:hypothetical protein